MKATTSKQSSDHALTFTAKDFHHHDKNQFWYLGMVILLLAALSAAIWFKDYLTGAVVVAVGIAVFRLANLRPAAKKVSLTERGIYWGDRFFGYHQLRAFWVAAQTDQATLYLERLNLQPAISFTVPQSSLDKAVGYLSDYLPLHSHRGEPLADRLSRLLKL